MTTLVLQPWLTSCSWKEQTCLLCALRGPDASAHPLIKSWVRWIRSVVCKNAAPRDRFMQTEDRVSFLEIERTNADVLNELPVHFLSHMMHALQIIGVRHSDTAIALEASNAYVEICSYLHVNPESDVTMRKRLEDRVL